MAYPPFETNDIDTISYIGVVLGKFCVCESISYLIDS